MFAYTKASRADGKSFFKNGPGNSKTGRLRGVVPAVSAVWQGYDAVEARLTAPPRERMLDLAQLFPRTGPYKLGGVTGIVRAFAR